MVSSEELIGTTQYLTLYTRCRINRVQLYIQCINIIAATDLKV
jgi:hypothetical protein